MTASDSAARQAAPIDAVELPSVTSGQAPVARPAWLGVRGFLPLFTALVAITSVLLHLMGEELHRAYLHHWHLDVGLFPKSTDWLLINGFYGAMVVLAEAVSLVLGHLLWLPLIVARVAVYIGLLLTPLALPAAIARWRITWPRWVERTVALMAAATALLVVLLATMVMLFSVALVPSRLARHAGEQLALAQAKGFSLGCEQSKEACVLVRMDGRELARGHVLESSTTHIALFDVEQKRAIALPRDGTETVSLRAPGKP